MHFRAEFVRDGFEVALELEIGLDGKPRRRKIDVTGAWCPESEVADHPGGVLGFAFATGKGCILGPCHRRRSARRMWHLTSDSGH
jgi:hypothetical protein